MLLLGLTGGIATGKSTVSNILRSAPHNLPVIDADVIAREVVEPGTAAYKAIVAHFGPSTPDLLLPASSSYSSPSSSSSSPSDAQSNRPLNRAALGRRVFGGADDPAAQKDRAVLNGIVHPAVRRAIYAAILKAYVRGAWAVVLDVPLLFESGWEPLCGTILVVATQPEVQMRRLRARNPELSAEEAGHRVASQMPVGEKVRMVEARGRGWGTVVWNDCEKEALRSEVERVMAEIRASSPSWWSWLLLLCPPLAVVTASYSCARSLLVKRRYRQQELQAKAKL